VLAINDTDDGRPTARKSSSPATKAILATTFTRGLFKAITNCALWSKAPQSAGSARLAATENGLPTFPTSLDRMKLFVQALNDPAIRVQIFSKKVCSTGALGRSGKRTLLPCQGSDDVRQNGSGGHANPGLSLDAFEDKKDWFGRRLSRRTLRSGAPGRRKRVRLRN